jgi:biopolymer transport protein ExbD
MSANLGASDKKSVNVDLNIVPFIDLMSCLCAFLMATAVWTKFSQIPIQPKGKARESAPTQETEEKPVISILLQSDKIIVGVSRIGTFQEIAKKGDAHDWEKFGETLKEHKKSADFADRADLELAAESNASSPVKYEDIIKAMDTAVAVGFIDVGLSDPAGLSARPVQ